MVKVIGPRDPRDKTAINVTSLDKGWGRSFSPMILGPVLVPGRGYAKNVENAWQYSKVYKCHMDKNGDPTPQWYFWSHRGFTTNRGIRYPMGKGAEPEYSFWGGKKMDYIEARKTIYMPIYAEAVKKSPNFQRLKDLYLENKSLTLWDCDGYDYLKMGRTLEECADDPNMILGHGFVLAMVLEGKL